MLRALLTEFSSPAALGLVLACVFFGSYVQSTIGIGLGLVAVPVVGLVAPTLVPQALVLAAMPLIWAMLWDEWSEASLEKSGWLVVGRAVGLFPGLWVLGIVSVASLRVMVGVVTLLAVFATAMVRRPFRITPFSQLVAGTLAGVTGTTTGIAGAPIALLYSSAPPEMTRTALTVANLMGASFSVIAYAVDGRIRGVDLTFTLVALLPVTAGWLVGRRVREIVPRHIFRIGVYTLVAITAVILLVQGLTA